VTSYDHLDGCSRISKLTLKFVYSDKLVLVGRT